MNIQTASLLTVLTIIPLSVYFDLRERRIPNFLTFPFILIGLVFSFYISKEEFIVRLLTLIIFFLFGSMRLLGMGDLKLLMAIIALRGPFEGIYTLLCAALLMIWYCMMERPADTVISLKNTFLYFAVRKPITVEDGKAYPFALFIAVGYPMGYILSNLI